MTHGWSACLSITVPLTLALIGCADDAPDGTDGGVEDAGDGAVDAPIVVPPRAPALPTLTPCFDGFSETPLFDDVVACEPWPGGEPDDCALFEAHFPGRASCERVGTTCPGDGLPAGAGADAVFVRAGASGGDGSRDAPFGTVGDALEAASAGDTIAIGVGTYDEEIVVDRPVRLLGACAESVVLRSADETLTAGVVTVAATGVAIENVRIADSARSGIWVEGAHAVTIHDVVVHDVRMIGVDAERGASLDVARLVVRDVARAELPPVVGFFGRGLNVETGASATVRSLVVTGAAEFGVLSFAEGAHIDLERAAISNTIGRADGTGGVGLMALGGGSLEARGVVVSGARESAAAAVDAGSTILLEDAVLARTRPQEGTGVGGRALNLQNASGTCRRCLLRENLEASVFVAGGSATLADLVVASTSIPTAGEETGRGVEVQAAAAVTADRVLVDDAVDTGVIAGGAGTVFTLRDLVVRDVSPIESTGERGRGVTVQSGARLTLERARIEDVYEHGILVSGAELLADDVEVRRVFPAVSGGYFGRGIAAQAESTVRGSRIDIGETMDVGFLALLRSAAELRDLRVANTAIAACALTSCPTIPGGHGIGVYESSVSVEGVLVEGHDVCGIHIAAEGDAALRTGLVSGNAIGACVQSEAQDVAMLQRDVDYVDNGLNLETTDLPIPEAVPLSL